MRVLLAHVISIRNDINKGTKAIRDIIYNKLKIDNGSIIYSNGYSTIEKELTDLRILDKFDSKEKKILYLWKDCWVDSDTLLRHLEPITSNEGNFILGQAIEFNYPCVNDYINMMDECAILVRGYYFTELT